MNVYTSYGERLRALAEPGYKAFQQKLIPNADNILGVRLPAIRVLAKELAKGDWQRYFAENRDAFFEETMLQGMTVGYLTDLETVLEETRRFIPKITNWSLCDSFCSGLSITRQHGEAVWRFVLPYFEAQEAYALRFAVVMLLNYFCDEAHIIEAMSLLEGIRHPDYYVKMVVAWAIAEYYVNFPAQTLPFLRENALDDFTHNKALQKICESRRIDDRERARIRGLKR